MPKARFAAIGVLAAFAAGCSGADTAQPAPSATVTVTAEAPSATPKAQPATLKVGQQRPFNDADSRGSVAVLKFRQPFPSSIPPERAGYEFAGVEVRRCYKTISREGGLTVGWGPWTLGYRNGNIVESPNLWSANQFSVPLYPRERPVRAGQCIRGWIPYEVKKGTRPATVAYTLDASATNKAVQVEWATR